MNLSITEHLTYYSLRLISRIIAFIPRRAAARFGSGFGYLVWILLPIRKKRALKNVAIAFPDSTRRDQINIVRNTYRHYGVVLMDFMRVAYLTPKKIAKFITIDSAAFKLLKEKGRGVLLTGHMGNWEMFPPALGLNGINFTGVALEQRNLGANQFFKWLRESTGIRIVFKKRESTKKMLKVLEDSFLGLASDQYAGKNGIRMNFFGRETSTPAGAAVFHLKTGCPLIFGTCILQDNYKYFISMEELIIPDLPEDREETIRIINTLYHEKLENVIRQYPYQYFWFHRKWRN